ncbi:hypothetical protein F4776DRAFT_662580 [Hypoxylon sp. NC0597]|nr:hypothetical protein F4776DRAFT_662580 [Hypoxylon sp. NC0597]
MSDKLSIDASGDSGVTPIKREVSLSPPPFDNPSKSSSEKDTDGWEVLSQHSPIKHDGDDDGDKNSSQSESPAGCFNGSGRWPESWAVGIDMLKSEHQPSQPTPEGPNADEENSNQNTLIEPGPNPNPDSKVDTIKDNSLIMQASSEEPGPESLFWVSGHVDMLVAERRELFMRIEKLESLAKTQAAALERIDNLQNQIDQMREGRENTKKTKKKCGSARKQEMKKVEDKLLQVEEDIDYLSQDIDYVLDDFGALQDTVVDLTDESTSLNAKVTELTKRLEKCGEMNNVNGGLGGPRTDDGDWVEQMVSWNRHLQSLTSRPGNNWEGTSWAPTNIQW